MGETVLALSLSDYSKLIQVNRERQSAALDSDQDFPVTLIVYRRRQCRLGDQAGLAGWLQLLSQFSEHIFAFFDRRTTALDPIQRAAHPGP